MITVPEALEGFTALKAGIDLLRSAAGLVTDAQKMLPPEKAEAVGAAIEASKRQIAIAEAQIAQSMGFTLHHCQFPPPIMFEVGYKRSGERVYECPVCHGDTSTPITFTRTRNVDGSSLRTAFVRE